MLISQLPPLSLYLRMWCELPQEVWEANGQPLWRQSEVDCRGIIFGATRYNRFHNNRTVGEEPGNKIFLKKSSLSSGDAWSLTDNLSFFLRFKNPRLTRWILFSFFKFVTFKAIDRAYKYSPNLKLVAFKRKYDGRDSWFPQSLCY